MISVEMRFERRGREKPGFYIWGHIRGEKGKVSGGNGFCKKLFEKSYWLSLALQFQQVKST